MLRRSLSENLWQPQPMQINWVSMSLGSEVRLKARLASAQRLQL